MTLVLHLPRPPAGTGEPPSRAPGRLHRALGVTRPSPLAMLPGVAADLGVAAVDVKVEAARMGLPSFKIMGTTWATVAALAPYLPAGWSPADGFSPLAGALPPLTLVAATEGNHGHALAAVARLLGLRARVFVPESVNEARVPGMLALGAEVLRVAGSYDEAVLRSAADAEEPGRLLVSDTSWPGYEDVPAAVIEGYGSILWELEEQHVEPDLVIVPTGVGAFAAAVIRHFRRAGARAPRIVGVEPTEAACVTASLAAGRRVTVPGPHRSIMSGLNCGTPSYVAWPVLRRGFDAMVVIDDEAVEDAVGELSAAGLRVGQCSGAALAAARVLLSSAPDRTLLDLPDRPSVLLFATEGADEAPVTEGTGRDA